MTTYTEQQMQAIGGKRWVKSDGTVRYYFNGWKEWIAFEVEYYKTDNVRSATIDGRLISNSAAKRFIAGQARVYWEAGCVHTTVSKAADNAGIPDYGIGAASLDERIHARIAELVAETEKAGNHE